MHENLRVHLNNKLDLWNTEEKIYLGSFLNNPLFLKSKSILLTNKGKN